MGEWDETTQVRARPLLGADRVLLADADPAARQWFRSIVAGHFSLEEIDAGDRALDRIAAGTARIVVIGRTLTDMSGEQLLARAAQWLVPERRTPVTFLLADAGGAVAAVDDAKIQVYYRLVRSMQPERVRELLAQAASKLPPRPPHEPDPQLAAAVAEYTKKLGELSDPDDVAHGAIVAVRGLVSADRARCLFCDEETGQMWAGSGADDEGSHAWSGLAGFAMRAVCGVAVSHAGDDPLYRREIDDPIGTGRERIAVQAVAGPDGHVHAVLIALREPNKPPFIGPDLERLEALATAWAPYLMQLSMRIEADQILGDRLDAGPSDMFRQEAIMHLVRRGQRGDVVRVHPGWIRAAYWLVLASLAGAGAFAALATVHQYTEGPALVQFTGRTELIATEAGTISALKVRTGQKVAAGEILARLHDSEQVGRLKSLETEFERKLVAYLLTPADPSIRESLSSIVSQRDSARAAVESHTIRATHAGIVKEVLVRNGQPVEAGKPVVTIVENASSEGLKLLAFLPGSDRPRIHAHQPLRLTLPGYRGAHIVSEVRAVSEVIGPADARTRWIGAGLADSIPLTGSVVVVEAQLTSPDFESDGQTFQLHDGMTGIVEVQLQSRSIIATLIPGLQ